MSHERIPIQQVTFKVLEVSRQRVRVQLISQSLIESGNDGAVPPGQGIEEIELAVDDQISATVVTDATTLRVLLLRWLKHQIGCG